MSEFQPLTGRKVVLATALQDVTGGVPTIDNPAKVENIAKFATSDFNDADNKIMSDALEDRAAESDGMGVGTFEPAGTVEFLLQEDGATLDVLTMTAGNPGVTAVPADALNHLAAYDEHLFKLTNAYRFGVVLEKAGASHFVRWGARVGQLSIGVAKRQNQFVRVQAQMMALNGVNNKSATAGADTGLSTAAASGNPYFEPVRAILRRAGTQWTGAREFNVTINWNLDRADDLDGLRGMAPFAPDGTQIEASVTVFFSTEAEHRRFLGELDLTKDVYGATFTTIEEDLELVIPGPRRGAVATDDLFTPEISLGLYRAVITVYQSTKGKGAIEQRLTMKPNFKRTENTDAYIKVKNQIPASYYTTAGTPLANVTANAGSAYTAA